MDVKKIAEVATQTFIDIFLDDVGISYSLEQKEGDPRYYKFSFSEDGNVFFEWQTWKASKAIALRDCFFNLFGHSLISTFPDNFSFKEERNEAS